MKSICFIAARGDSKGVPRKNIRKLGKKPLIAYSIEQALDSGVFSDVIVSTEDPKIAKISKKYGAKIPFMRPKKLAKSNTSMDEVLIHGVQKLEELGYSFDILLNRDCTAPFIQTSALRSSINLLKKKKCDLVIAAYPSYLNPYFNMMELDKKGYLKFSKSKGGKRSISRQLAPVVYQLSGLYAINIVSFKKYKKIFMPKILPYVIPPETGLMIDTKYEFRLAQAIMKNHIQLP